MYDKAIQLNPQYSKAYNNKGLKYIYGIGLCLKNLNRYDEMELMLTKAKEV